MKPSYQGNAKPYALALYDASDAAIVLPVLHELDEHGLNLSYKTGRTVGKSVIRRACIVIAFLSARSIADNRTERAILLAKAMQVPLVCVNLDRTPLHDSLNSLLYTSNVIFADRYTTPASLAERILTAEPLAYPALTKAQAHASRRTALLLMAGALLIVTAAGLLIWQRIEAASKVQTQTVQQEEPPVDIAGILSSGMTQEDLLDIRTLILVGDQMINPNKLGNYRDWTEVITQMEIDGKTVWSMDGKEIPRGTVTDISLIGRMSNLQDLILLNQSVTDLSPLRSLTNLSYIEIVDCPVESIEALSGMPRLLELVLDQTKVASLLPLQNCTMLKYFRGSLAYCASLEGLGLPSMREITLFDIRELKDLGALSACSGLIHLSIHADMQLTDISGLGGCTALKALFLEDATALHNCASLSELTQLEQLELYNVGITDLSPLRQSRGLKVLHLEEVPVRDLSWTSGMDQLHNVMLHSTNLRDLNFLNSLGVTAMELSFSGDIDDYSGLAAISTYTTMHLNPKNKNLAAVLPYITNAKFMSLQLYECNGIDFSTLPQQINNLQITKGNLADLEGIALLPNLSSLTLEDTDRLSSLDGMADSKKLMRVTIDNCARMMDYDDLYVRPYAMIELKNQLTAPDLSRLQITDFGNLTLENMSCISDISPLEACQTDINSLQLHNITTVRDLSVLKKMHVNCLVVPPQLEEQAAQLRDEDYINTYEVYYPEDTLWAEEEEDFTLLSLEELDTLPDVLLGRVRELTIIGDCLQDPGTQDWTEQWDNKGQHFIIVDRASGEMTPVGPGAVDQIGSLGKLTGLQYLRLYDQPLTNLQGIQALAELRNLEIRKCPITDAAAAFTLTQLEGLSLFNTQITSIQGIQNLTKLTMIDINSTKVTDLSPLEDCDFGYAMENGGLRLSISWIPCEDFSALASIEAFIDLGLQGHDATLWLPYIAGHSVRYLDANRCNLTNDQIALIAAIPQLRELHISGNENVTDLSPLLACQTLEKVFLNSYGKEAIASIEGKAHFTIEYQD